MATRRRSPRAFILLLITALVGSALALAPVREEPASAAPVFDDVPAGTWYSDAVGWLADAAITTIGASPPDEGVEATRRIRADYLETGVVVLSQHAEPEYVLRVFEAGNDGIAYLLKENVAALETLQSAVAAVDPALVSVLVSARTTRPSAVSDLTLASATSCRSLRRASTTRQLQAHSH
jgi:DNA-binding NarL/FixJ family response regulator